MTNCLFCKIRDGEIPSEIVYENEHVLAFNDINPSKKVHILVIPKEHYDSFDVIPPKIYETFISL